MKNVIQNNRNKTLLVIAALVFILIITGIIYAQKKHNIQAMALKANDYGLTGDFRKEIPININLYNASKNELTRAKYANQISQEYFNLSDTINGNYWAKQAADLYEKAGNPSRSKDVLSNAKLNTDEIKQVSQPKSKNTVQDSDL